MVVATQDTLSPTDLALDAYNRALEPKKLVLVPGGHFEPYTGQGFAISSGAARDWLVRHSYEGCRARQEADGRKTFSTSPTARTC